jgi:hypothetical protein
VLGEIHLSRVTPPRPSGRPFAATRGFDSNRRSIVLECAPSAFANASASAMLRRTDARSSDSRIQGFVDWIRDWLIVDARLVDWLMRDWLIG